MNITVQFLGILPDLTGCTEAKAELPEGAVVEDVMNWIAARFGTGLPAHVWDREQHRFGPLIMAFLDGTDVEDYGRPLRENGQVIFASMLAGGAC